MNTATVEAPAKPKRKSASTLLDERVSRGIALLDEKERHWRERVDPAKLVMIAANRCVLGQVFGMCWDGVAKLGLWDSQDRVEHGFWAASLDDYPLLEKAWRRRL